MSQHKIPLFDHGRLGGSTTPAAPFVPPGHGYGDHHTGSTGTGLPGPGASGSHTGDHPNSGVPFGGHIGFPGHFGDGDHGAGHGCHGGDTGGTTPPPPPPPVVPPDPGPATITGTADDDVLSGTTGNDVIDAGAGDDAVGGLAGDDALLGGDGNDDLNGNEGNDLLIGGAGDDILDGGTGTDQMFGGDGNDVYIVDSASDTVADSSGTDTVEAFINYTLGADVENLMLMGAATAGTGNAGNNTLQANDLGDTLSGLAGDDTLYGGAGNDSLNGGAGHDTLTGFAGADTFVLDHVTAADSETIADFNAAEGDVLDFKGVLQGFDPLTSLLSNFISLGTDGQGNTTVSVDANGAVGGAQFVQVATLQGVIGLDAAALLASGNIVVN